MKKTGGSVVRRIKSKNAVKAFLAVFILNFLLFVTKLYVGLSSNSISIYSDGINNFFDGISAAVSLICFYLLLKSRDMSFESRSGKTEQLLTFVLSAVIIITGIVFLFNSAERLMYPAPVWFTVSYFYIIGFTAVVKALMFFLLKRQSRKEDSQLFRVMSLDSLMDFFITTVTVITLFISQRGGFSVDAYAGIAISIFILVSGVRSFRESLTALICFPKMKTRERIEELLSSCDLDEKAALEFSFVEEKRVYLSCDRQPEKEKLEEVRKSIYEETGFTLYLLK